MSSKKKSATEMGGVGTEVEKEHEHLNQLLAHHFRTMQDTFELFSQKPSDSADRVSWAEVLKMGDRVSKQATVVGMLWVGQWPNAKALEENMAAYFNELQGFLLLSHGSLVGAGPTLSSNIIHAVKDVFDCSFKLMVKSIGSYGSKSESNKEKEASIATVAGTVWEACSALKKVPTTNITAIGRAMSQVAITSKDVLREMKELKPASSEPSEKGSDEPSREEGSEQEVADNSSEDDLGNDLSPEEMKVANAAVGVVSNMVIVIKELIRFITGLLKRETSGDGRDIVVSLEELLKHCRGIGLQVDEIGACLYPPQEASTMMVASGNMSTYLDDIQAVVENLGGTSEAFIQACNSFRSSLQQFVHVLSSSCTVDLEGQMQSTSLND